MQIYYLLFTDYDRKTMRFTLAMGVISLDGGQKGRFPTLFRVRGFIALHTLQGLIILQAIRTCNSIFFHSNIVNQMFLQ